MDILEKLGQPFTPPAVTADIPHGDMPGDKVVIGEGHIAKANAIFPKLAELLCGALEQNPAKRAVIAVCGGSGVGSETAYYGFYYCPGGLPDAVFCGTRFGTATDLQPEGEGFIIRAEDNHYYTQYIGGGFYYYEAHF